MAIRFTHASLGLLSSSSLQLHNASSTVLSDRVALLHNDSSHVLQLSDPGAPLQSPTTSPLPFPPMQQLHSDSSPAAMKFSDHTAWQQLSPSTNSFATHLLAADNYNEPYASENCEA